MKNTKMIFVLTFETFGRMHKKHFCVLFFLICFFFYYYSWKSKPGISIPDLYFYDVKILPDINPNDIKNTRKNYKMLKQIRWTVPYEQSLDVPDHSNANIFCKSFIPFLLLSFRCICSYESRWTAMHQIINFSIDYASMKQ